MSGLYRIESKGGLCAVISDMGAQLCALRYRGRDYLWNANAAFWADSAPNLFPYVGRLTEGAYTYNGKTYHMDIHGFAKDSRFEAVTQTQDSVVFVLRADAKTRAQYPFDFVFRVQFCVTDATLSIVYTVENIGENDMYFGVGGHPGFRLPLQHGLAFSDYYLEFSAPCEPERIVFSDRLLVKGQEPYLLQGGRTLRLNHAVFDDDAIVLRGMADAVTLKCDASPHAVTVRYPKFRYLGIWHAPKTQANYVCIEPWSSLPSRDGLTEDLTKQKDLMTLAQGGVYKNEWCITVQ